MKKILSLLLIISFSSVIGQELSTVSGKIIDERFEPLENVSIVNINSGKQVRSNENGLFQVKGSVGDTLQFQFVSLRLEQLVIDRTENFIKLIMVEDIYPNFGTEKTYERFEKKERKRLKKLYKIAENKGVWYK
jgi:hypothetical protein